jgi:hypothetical protein
MAEVVEQAVQRCASCAQPLTGRYCAHCGEQAIQPEARTVRHFVGHIIVDELVHLDGKFWTTLRRLAFRPGFLSHEFSAGRRRLYLKPVRLLIAAIITYALLTQGGFLVTITIAWLHLSVAPTSVPENVSVAETVRRIDRFGILTRTLEAQARATDVTAETVRQRFHTRLNQFAEPLSFANVVLLACALYLFFRRRRAFLVDHAVFSMHFVSFVLLSSLALLPAVWLMEAHSVVGLTIILAVTVWQFAYLAVAIRRFYFFRERTSLRLAFYSTAAALLIYILNSAFLTAVQLLGGAIALRSI